MGEMATKTILEAAQSLAADRDLQQFVEAANSLQFRRFAVRAVRPATVRHGSARLRFSLTGGISDDELVRLENNVSFFCPLVPSVCSSRLEEKKSGSRAPTGVGVNLPAVQSWREDASRSAAVARA